MCIKSIILNLFFCNVFLLSLYFWNIYIYGYMCGSSMLALAMVSYSIY